MDKLTKMQEKTLQCIKEFKTKHGYPPTVREIGQELDLSSPATVHTHLTALANKGYIKKGNSKNRAIELLIDDNINTNTEIVKVPLLGKVTAGNPIEAIERPDEFFDLPAYMIPKNQEVFTLTVSGESMINAGIFDNDIVVVQRCNTANNGEMVIAMNDNNEVTLKTFYKEKDHIRLQPENDTMAPIILPNVTILGKAIGLYRKI